MSYEDILETSEDGRYRVKLVADQYADEPYDDGQSPLLQLDLKYGSTYATHVMDTGRPTDNDERIEEATERWGSDFGMLEKYLRAYYGCIEFETWHSGSYWYITYDTATWRKYIGFEPDDETPHRFINMNEWRAYCEGDVWGYVVEKNVTWNRADDPDESMQTWEEVDEGSLWGMYGYDYAKESALEAFRYVTEEVKS